MGALGKFLQVRDLSTAESIVLAVAMARDGEYRSKSESASIEPLRS